MDLLPLTNIQADGGGLYVVLHPPDRGKQARKILCLHPWRSFHQFLLPPVLVMASRVYNWLHRGCVCTGSTEFVCAIRLGCGAALLPSSLGSQWVQNQLRYLSEHGDWRRNFGCLHLVAYKKS